MILLDESIDTGFFFRLCNSINNCLYEDLLQLREIPEDEDILEHNSRIPEPTMIALSTAGFFSNNGFDLGKLSGGDSGAKYRLNSYGKALRGILLS